nr:MAG TPA: hypothetical protein [Caudoviricetes sp.]
MMIYCLLQLSSVTYKVASSLRLPIKFLNKSRIDRLSFSGNAFLLFVIITPFMIVFLSVGHKQPVKYYCFTFIDIVYKFTFSLLQKNKRLK